MRRLISVALLTLVVTGIVWVGLSAGMFAGFQRRATDALFPSAPSDPHVVVVGIDGKTIDQYGATPSRTTVAALTRALTAAGARVIAFDAIYRTELTEEQKSGDAEFAAAIDANGNVVLATKATFESGDVPPDAIAPQAIDLTGIAEGLQKAHFTFGHVQVNADPIDGINRSLPLVIEDPDGQFVPALSLAAVMLYRGFEGPVTVRPDGVQIGNRFVPTDDQHSMLLNFSARLSDPTRVISMADVLAGSVPRHKIAGKIVLVGAIDSTLGDNRVAPVNKATGIPGVLLHANAVNTMLTGTYLEPVSDTSTLLWVAMLTAVVALAVVMLPFWLSPAIALLLGIGCFVISLLRFNNGQVLNLVYLLGAIVLAFFGAVILRYFGETRQRRRVTALFSQYVPETVAKRLVEEDRASAAAEGERLDMTVLFCDLRGFTALSESLSPATVRVMLNHYYDRVTDIVLEMHGTLMKYVGDEVFAVWGAPLPSDDHPQTALQCAIAIQQLTPELNRELLERGAPEVSFGIGLNSGDAVAAHFGGGRRRQYDVVGDTVNVGARLCSAAGRGEIIVSDELLVRVPHPPPVEPVGPVTLKGVSREVRLWRVILPGTVSADPPAAVDIQPAGAGVVGVAGSGGSGGLGGRTAERSPTASSEL